MFKPSLVVVVIGLLASSVSFGDGPKRHQQGVAPNKLSARDAIKKLDAEKDPFWLNAKREVDLSVPELLAQGDAEDRKNIKINKMVRCPSNDMTVTLTFDDGPHPDFTPKLLQILQRENIKASFFLVGQQAEKYPALVRAISRAGHTVGNHTYHHVSLPKIPLEYAAEEVKACGDVLKTILGRPLRFFRPPGGRYDLDIAHAVNELGYTLVLWTDNPGDFEQPGTTAITERTLDRISPGGIILMHDGVQQTIDALPGVIEQLKAKGYRFESLDQVVDRAKAAAKNRKPAARR